MSTRALAWTALLLGLLVAGSGALLLHRLGYLGAQKPLQFRFENPTLDVARGQRVIVRPMLKGAAWRRYTFLVVATEPQSDDPVYPAPHVRAGVEELEDGTWYRLRSGDFVQPLAMCQMGAATVEEWLEEIQTVRERDLEGEGRILIRALFGNPDGSKSVYFFVPGEPVPAFGWIRQEKHQGETPEAEVHFASDDGIVDLFK